MPGEAILNYLSSEADKIELQSVDLAQADIKAALTKKCNSKSLKRLSFSFCKLGYMTDISEIAELIKSSQAEVVGLNYNDLDKLSDENFCLLLQALLNPHIQKIELNNNNLNKLILSNKNAFIQFLKSSSATCLDLSENNITNETSLVLGEHSEFLSIQLKNNNIGNEGCELFLTNPYLVNINLYPTNVDRLMKNKIQGKKVYNTNRILEDIFLERATQLAQGFKTPGNCFNLLPHDLLLTIFHLIADNLRLRNNFMQVCNLLIDNIQSKSGKLDWKHGPVEAPIFKKRVTFFKAHHYAGVEKNELKFTPKRKDQPNNYFLQLC